MSWGGSKENINKGTVVVAINSTVVALDDTWRISSGDIRVTHTLF